MKWYEFCRPYFTWIGFGNNRKLNATFAQGVLDSATKAGSDVLMFFVQSNSGYALWNSRVAPRDPFAEEGFIPSLIEKTHSSGLKFVAMWMGAHFQAVAAQEHPLWCMVDSEGEVVKAYGMPFMCLNSPFRTYLLEQVREILRYKVDGVYFDGVYAASMLPVTHEACYSLYCKQKFEKLYGTEAPKHADWNNPQWRNFVKFRKDTVVDFCRETKQLITAVSPNTAFIVDVYDASGYKTGQDIVGQAPYIDAFALESYWYYKRQPLWMPSVEYQIIKSEAGKAIWCPHWFPRHADFNFANWAPQHMKLQLMEGVLNGGSPVYVADPDAMDYNQASYAPLQAVSKCVEALAPHLPGSESLAYAALVYSPPVGSDVEHLDSFRGFFSTLIEHHIPFEIVSAKHIQADRLSRHRVIILPNALYLSDAAIASIVEFVKKGGGLVMTYRSSLYDERGFERHESPLSQLAGIEFTGLTHRDGVLVTSRGVGLRSTLSGESSTVEPQNYYKLTADHEITRGLEYNLFSYRGAFMHAQCYDGVQVLARALDYDYSRRDPVGEIAWYPGRESHPLITVRQEKGRVVYIAGDLDSAALTQGYPELGQLLANAVKWAGYNSLPIEAECPPSIRIASYINMSKKSVTIMLVNHATNQINPTTDWVHPIRYVTPVRNIVLRLRVPETFKLEHALALTGQQITHSRSDKIITVKIPEVGEFEGIILE